MSHESWAFDIFRVTKKKIEQILAKSTGYLAQNVVIKERKRVLFRLEC